MAKTKPSVPAPITPLEADRESHQRYVMLTNLLARIHRDGGQYVKQHGLDKAFADADAIVAELYAAPVSEAKAQDFDPLVCDYCNAETQDPWHGSGMLNGVESRHIHACDQCRNLLPTAKAQGVVMPDGWRIRECEDVDADLKGFIISSPLMDGERSSNSVWHTDADPAHRLLYEILDLYNQLGENDYVERFKKNAHLLKPFKGETI